MAKQNLNIGSAANDGTGDTLRDGAIKLNNVINEIYATLGDGSNLNVQKGSPSANQVLKWDGNNYTPGDLSISNLTDVDTASIADGQVLKWNTANSRFQPGDDLLGSGEGGGLTNLSNNGNDEVVASTNIIPNSDITYDLGSATNRWRDLYVSNGTVWIGDYGLGADATTGEPERKRRKSHTLAGVTTGTNGGADADLEVPLSSSDNTAYTQIRDRFMSMSAGTDIEVTDGTNTATGVFVEYVAESSPTTAKVRITPTAAGDVTALDAMGTSVEISSTTKQLSVSEAGKVEVGDVELRFGDDTKVLKFSANNELDLGTNSKIKFGSDNRKIEFTADGQLELPETGSIRFGTNDSKKLTVDSNNRLQLNGADVDGGRRAAEAEAANGSYTIKEGSARVAVSSPALRFEFAAPDSTAYVVTGPGWPGAGSSNPDFKVYRGFTYILKNTAGGGHPLRLQSTSGLSGTAYNDGIVAGASQTGTQVWVVPHDAPATLYYQCTNHSAMNGTITVV